MKKRLIQTGVLISMFIAGFCLVAPEKIDNAETTYSNSVLAVNANINDMTEEVIHYENDKDTVVLAEKIAMHPEYIFTDVNQTGYFLEDTVLKKDPYNDAENADQFKKYDEITLTGTNDLQYWEVTVNETVYYVNKDNITTDKKIIEDMQEQERIKAKEEEAKRKAEAEAARRAATYNTSWTGSKLTKNRGVNYGPSGKETYYNLDMSGVISIMRSMGNNDEYWVRDDGCKMLGDYIMCAANLDVYPRGSLVESSLGTCIVCDTGSFAISNPYQLDIAVTW